MEYSPEAAIDVERALEYLLSHNTAAATRFFDRLLALVEKLDRAEFDGPEVLLSTGEIVRVVPVRYRYRLYYQRLGETLRVVRVYHGARRPIAP